MKWNELSTAKRLDSEIAERGLARSRNQAQQLIRAGFVLVDGLVEQRTGRLVSNLSTIDITNNFLPVSRAGLKLQHAIETFGVRPAPGQIAIDIGAATGGFTQILLEHGISLVVSVDVGTGQLAPELGEDARVISLESTDARTLTQELIRKLVTERTQSQLEVNRFAIETSPSLITIDVSFISLRHLLPTLTKHFQTAQVIALFKPQFEVGRHALGKNGVVRDSKQIEHALAGFQIELTDTGAALLGVTESPITGLHGNKEFLLWITLQTAEHHGELSQLPIDWIPRAIGGETLIRR